MILDFHNHLVPGVDDGARDTDQSRSGLNAFVAAEVAQIIATPHLDGSLTLVPDRLARRLADLDAGWLRLAELAAAEFPQLSVQRGVECMLDVPEPDFSDPRLRLAGGSFVLVEFPFMMIPPESARALSGIRSRGYTPVLAHPERYDGLSPDLELIQHWRGAGAVLQVNAGSLLGRYGSEVRARAFKLLERGWVDYMCSDYHARGEVATAAARQLLAEAGAEEQASLLTEVNPARLLAGKLPLPVPALEQKRSIWSNLFSLVRRERGHG